MKFKIYLEKTLSKVLVALLISLFINFIILLLVDGPIWVLFCVTLWILICSNFGCLFFFLLKDYILKKEKSEIIGGKIKVDKFLVFLKICLIIFILISIVILFPSYIKAMVHWKAEENDLELQRLTQDLIKNANTDQEKTLSILKWFDRSSENIHNCWHLAVNGKMLVSIPYLNLLIFSVEPYFCFHTFGKDNPSWILTSRCGACEEYSLLFREMASIANLTARRVVCTGENHLWDEILINGTWIVVDPTEVDLPLSSGFNLSTRFFEQKVKNVSHVYAEYQNGTIEDITYRYTNLTNVSFLTLDSSGNFISDVKIRILSNNKGRGLDTGLTCTTNNTGRCQIRIGGGSYTFVSEKELIPPLYDETTISLAEGEIYNFTIILKSDLTKSPILFIPILAVIIFLIFLIYVRKKVIKKSKL